MGWNASSKKKKGSDPSEFHLQKLPVTTAELAEDAGHMGYTSTFYPGSSEWEAEAIRNKKRREDRALQMKLAL